MPEPITENLVEETFLLGTGLNADNISLAERLVWALNNKLRLRLIKFIEDGKRVTAKQIYTRAQISQGYAWQQVSKLIKAGIVLVNNEGQDIIYTINYPLLKQINKAIDRLSI